MEKSLTVTARDGAVAEVVVYPDLDALVAGAADAHRPRSGPGDRRARAVFDRAFRRLDAEAGLCAPGRAARASTGAAS